MHAPLTDQTQWCGNLKYTENSAELRRSRDRVVLDIGAHMGDTSVFLHLLHPSLRVVSLEPMPISYFYLRWNLHVNRVPLLREDDFTSASSAAAGGGVLALHAGATADGRRLTMAWDPSRSKASHALTKEAVAGTRSNTDQIVTTRSYRIPSLLSSLRVDGRLPLLKLDCEYCEYEVLPDLEHSGVLTRTGRLVGEVHRPTMETQRTLYHKWKKTYRIKGHSAEFNLLLGGVA